MSSAPPGQRRWKCPQCGNEVLLSVTQLDPIACEACMAKLKSGVRTSAAGSTGPTGLWSGLPEMTKLGIVAVALVLGLVIGYLVGKKSVPPVAAPPAEARHLPVKVHTEESAPQEEPEVEQESERPPAPGPGYKWVRGRTRKDGTRGEGHWAKDPRYKAEESSGK